MIKITHIKPDQISGGILFVFSLFLISNTMELGAEAKLFPLIVSGLIIVFSLVLFAQSFKLKQTELLSKKPLPNLAAKLLMVVLVLTVAYLYLLPVIGFEISSFCYLILVMAIIEQKFLWSRIIISALVTIVLMLIFSVGMNLRIPLLISNYFSF